MIFLLSPRVLGRDQPRCSWERCCLIQTKQHGMEMLQPARASRLASRSCALSSGMNTQQIQGWPIALLRKERVPLRGQVRLFTKDRTHITPAAPTFGPAAFSAERCLLQNVPRIAPVPIKSPWFFYVRSALKCVCQIYKLDLASLEWRKRMGTGEDAGNNTDLILSRVKSNDLFQVAA